MKNIGISIFCALVAISCSTNKQYYEVGDKVYTDRPNEPGACYAKCWIPDYYETMQDTDYIYTGTIFPLKGVEQEVIETEGTTKWEKRKADKNCLSANPEDCMVWCLVEVPGTREVTYYVIDTALVDEYELEIQDRKEMVRHGSKHEWVEVLCRSKHDPNIYYDQLKYALVAKGYEISDDNLKKDIEWALGDFQVENYLPECSVNKVTLGALGIEEYRSYYEEYIDNK